MFKDVVIYIPSKQRVNKQTTFNYLAPELQKITQILVDKEDYPAYVKQYQDNTLCLPDGCDGIGNVRHWAITNSTKRYVFLVDDDMVFFKRIGDTVKLAACTPQEQIDMFNTLLDWLIIDEVPLVGVSARQGNNHQTSDDNEATRQMNFHGVDTHMFKALGLKFNGLPVMEDFYLTLTLLTMGIANRVLYKYCWNQLGSGADGGCSSYRTTEVQKEAALELEKKWPEYVTVVKKKSKSGWKGLEERYDVRVQWKKAYIRGTTNK